MNTPSMPNVNDAGTLYVMYNELCTLSHQKKEYKSVLKFFDKVAKYFNIIYTLTTNDPNTNKTQLDNLQAHFFNIKKIASIASSELGYDKLEDTTSEDQIDEFEKDFYYESNKPKAYNKIAEKLMNEDALVSAITFLKMSLQINPNNYENYRIIGDLYNKINDTDMAVAFYNKYLEFNPNNPLVYNALGEICSVKNKYFNIEVAIQHFKKALELLPNYQDAIRNLAIAYRNADDNLESVKYYSKLIKLNPTNDDYFNYACQKIKLRDFDEGWKYFEHRFDRETRPVVYPKTDKPRWDGKINLEDKILLVNCEQGYGDSIQFFRYLAQINAKKIIFRAQDSLVDLLKLNTQNIEIIKKSTLIEKIDFDYHIPIMSLPFLLKTKIEDIPFTKGYIKADKNIINKYKKEYFNNNCLKIGITWHGAAWGNELRNIPLNVFYSLAKLPNVKVYSFQKDVEEGTFENLPEGIEIIDLGKIFNDFCDTAAAMANVDLFISSDNAVFNLAGAMGKNTFLLLNRDSEWRWFLDEETTPWYNSVKIFKKKYELENWDVIMQRVIDELKVNDKYKID